MYIKKYSKKSRDLYTNLNQKLFDNTIYKSLYVFRNILNNNIYKVVVDRINI